MTTGERIREIILESGKTYQEISDDTDITTAALNRYANGKTDKIPATAISKLAKYFNVSPLWLMGMSDNRIYIRDNKGRRVPVLGRIACGAPILAEENIERYETVDDESVDFALTAVGDSMEGVGIHPGDTIYIHSQPEVENGEIAAVIIDGEATLKRVYINDKVVTLVPCNDKYAPMAFVRGQADIAILGKAVSFKHRL